MANNKSSVKEIMSHLSVETSNTVRLISISSSSSKFTLGTFLSATEKVNVEENHEDLDEGLFSQLRYAHNFQVVTRLQNFICSNQQEEMRRTYLRKRQTISSDGRSIDGKLTLGFLGEYAAAVQVNMLRSISLAKYEDLPDKDARVGVKIARPKPQTERFINLRAEMPNVLFSTEDWNKQANKLTAIEEPTCFNKLKHVDPMVFEDAVDMAKHTATCYGRAVTGVQVSQVTARARGRGRN